ncbi:recombinational DNA repair protein (RecE pathway) [Paenibacillus sp. 79R4]|uniref:recombinational DNA repair protein (RecE pathway) n=1 Tax=Paenibacillus sp. 79R4 TaxID=2212847 RepID=UPI0015BFF2DE|nr:recombinational DNA repair protein (RecE pathway) [Paenibacillus sp. 79R4]NWL89599.1 recombinational DNA repair protein (RecE pathway) [Paenibacillus sp. 79R4]
MTAQQQAAVAKKEPTQSERFMAKVVSEYGSNVGEVALTSFQKRLAQNYFIALDSVLKTTEEKRLKKSEKYRDALPVTWANVNMDKLARDVVAYARIGFDPSQPNHINLIPFKNNNTNKYDIGFIEGYRGLELKSVKYGLDVPDHVTVELVYSNDYFAPIKKDANHPYEGYEFEIKNPFDRGTILGGFYFHSYVKTPEKNKLVMMTIKEIEKRKPDHASPEFWGGEKDKWKWDEKAKKNVKDGTEQVEGWYEKMCWKTVYRAAHSDITIDSQKIDDDYLRLKQMESDFAEAEVEREISTNANRDIIDITPPAGNEGDSNKDESPTRTTTGQHEMDFEIDSDDIPPLDGEGPENW